MDNHNPGRFLIMPTDRLRTTQIKMLTYAIYALIFILTTVTAWNSVCINSMPNDYVRLERYKEDKKTQTDYLIRIEKKLDYMIGK